MYAFQGTISRSSCGYSTEVHMQRSNRDAFDCTTTAGMLDKGFLVLYNATGCINLEETDEQERRQNHR
jgi:hypothetical protein